MAELMRLICPNCDAEYEVEAALIPETGRDVQCSNCGHGWFQPSPEAEALAADDEALFAPSARTQGSGPAMTAPEATAEEDDEDLAPLATATATAVPGGARTIDASVLDVLREEAERESRARRSEAGALEHQGEMGLEAAASDKEALEERLARLKGESDGPTGDEATPAVAGQKRQMLPEIDAINSTLRAKSEKRSGEAAAIADTLPAVAPAKSGFRSGFLLSLAVVVLAIAVYVLAPMLAQRVPALAEPLAAYGSTVDGLRLALDSALRRLVVLISSLIGSA